MSSIIENLMQPRPHLNDEQIEAIIRDAAGNIPEREACLITHYMLGFVRNASSLEAVRNELFFHVANEIQKAKEKK